MTHKHKSLGYKRYPFTNIAIYHGATIIHYLLGGLGIASGYGFTNGAWAGAAAYIFFAAIQFYLLMPLMVCPSCAYTHMAGARCITGFNNLARQMRRYDSPKHFSQRAQGWLCHNNLYIAALALPLIAILPALFLDFSWLSLGISLALAALLAVRIFIIFPRLACGECRARAACPNAKSMKLV